MDKLMSEYAVMESAERALAKAGRGKKFDPDIFDAVAKNELNKLRGGEINERKR